MYHKNTINTKYSNYSLRKPGIEVDTIVIHYTQLGFKESHKVLTQSGKVSSHFLIKVFYYKNYIIFIFSKVNKI